MQSGFIQAKTATDNLHKTHMTSKILYFLIVIFCALFSESVKAQSPDSVLEHHRKTYLEAESDSVKALALFDGGAYLASRKGDYDSAVYTLRKSADIAGKKSALAGNAFYFMAISMHLKGDFHQAEVYGIKSVEIFEAAERPDMIPKVYNVLGASAKNEGQAEKSITLFIKAIEAAEKVSDSSTVMNAAGNLSILLRNTDKKAAEKYIRLTMAYALATESYTALLKSYLNLVNIFDEETRIDSTMYYLNKADEIAQKVQNPHLRAAVDIALGNTLVAEGQLDSGEYYLRKGEPVMRKFDRSNWLGVVRSLASVKHKKGDYKAALFFLNEERSVEEKYLTLNDLKKLHLQYYETYKALNYSDSALTHLELHKMYADSLDDESNKKVLANLERKYETEKKEEKIRLLEDAEKLKAEKIRQQNQMLYMGLAALLITLASLFFVIWLGMQRKRTNKALELKNKEVLLKSDSLKIAYAEINQQKEEIQAQADNLRDINKNVTEKNKKITDSIRYARTIQTAVLPHENRLRDTFSDFMLIYRPQQIVSGDFYWLEQRGDYTFLAVADCTGHGVPGAFMSMLGSSFLTEIIDRESVREPADILMRLDRKVRNHLHQDDGRNSDGMDLSLCRIQKKEDHFEVLFSGVKSSLLYIENGNLKRIRGSSGTIGGKRLAMKEKEQHSVLLQKGSRLVLSTDGFKDQLSPERERFSTKQFLEVVSLNSIASMEEFKADLENSLEAHQRGMSQIDDICVLCVEL